MTKLANKAPVTNIIEYNGKTFGILDGKLHILGQSPKKIKGTQDDYDMVVQWFNAKNYGVKWPIRLNVKKLMTA